MKYLWLYLLVILWQNRQKKVREEEGRWDGWMRHSKLLSPVSFRATKTNFLRNRLLLLLLNVRRKNQPLFTCWVSRLKKGATTKRNKKRKKNGIGIDLMYERVCGNINAWKRRKRERERNICNTEGSLPTEVRAIGVSLSLSISGAFGLNTLLPVLKVVRARSNSHFQWKQI